MQPRGGPLFTFRQVPIVAGLLAARGVRVDELLADAGLPPSAAQGEVTAPLRRVADFVARCGERLGVACFGLELATALPGGTHGVAEFLARSAPTLGASVEVLRDFGSLINPSGRFRLVVDRDRGVARVHYTFGTERETLGADLNEYTIAYLVRQLGAALGERLPLAAVWFSHARRRERDAVAAHFGCAVRYLAADCGFAVSATVLERAPRTADPLLFDFLLEQARSQLARRGPSDIVAQLMQILETRLQHAPLSIAAAARALALAPRSLQRHLDSAGTSYRAVLTLVRERRRAELEAGGLPEAEIARRLGFAEVYSMRRALGRGGGRSPG